MWSFSKSFIFFFQSKAAILNQLLNSLKYSDHALMVSCHALEEFSVYEARW